MMLAPARRIAVSVSTMIRSRSSQPFAAAASTIAYSPLTWYAATGTGTAAATRLMMSSYASAGLIITMSAPSSRSSRVSLTASSALRGSSW
jgi:hypothetical protein